MPKQQLVANIDLDGVLYDFIGAMRKAFYRQAYLYDTDPLTWDDPLNWSVWEEWPITKDEFYDVMYREVLNGEVFGQGAPIEGARDGMLQLSELGYHIRIVTSKTLRSAVVTHEARGNALDWLYSNVIPYDTISFTDTRGKLDYQADLIVDDKPRFSQWVQKGSTNLLFNQNWNKTIKRWPDTSGWPSGGLSRVFSWPDVVEAAEALAGQERFDV